MRLFGDKADGNTGGKNSTDTAGADLLAGFQVRAAGKVGQAEQGIVQRIVRHHDADVVGRVGDACRYVAIRVAQQDNLRPVGADGGNAADQAVAGEDGAIFPDTLAGANVDLDGVSPIGGVAQDDAGQFKFPRLLLLPGDGGAERGVFRKGRIALLLENVELVVFVAKFVDLFEQLTAGGDGVDGFAGQGFGGAGEAEQGKEQAADPGLDALGGVRGKVQYQHGGQCDRTQRYVMSFSEHPAMPPSR